MNSTIHTRLNVNVFLSSDYEEVLPGPCIRSQISSQARSKPEKLYTVENQMYVRYPVKNRILAQFKLYDGQGRTLTLVRLQSLEHP